MHLSFIDSLDQIDCEQWNSITGIDYPFTRYEFLHALEISGATNRKSGWQPQHLLVKNDALQVIAVMPLYLKYHSYGEYVFDWAWANAYQRHGLEYYPKLLSAIPFTPATGPRLCIKAGEDQHAINTKVCEALFHRAEETRSSSIHILFPEATDSDRFEQLGLPRRSGAQFHWYNQGFNNFDDFLATFSSRKRKNLKKERRVVTEQNLHLEILEGPDISPAIWQRFFYFYQLTYAKRSGHGGYLDQTFFELIAETMPEHLVLVLAYEEKGKGELIAGALNFRDSKTLYGRYWGCIKEYEFLHFEACYYQGIVYCINNGLKRFDPGAQGEHKIQRGFTPITTWSNHWVAHPGFREAIADFLQQDNVHTQRYIAEAKKLLPFRQD